MDTINFVRLARIYQQLKEMLGDIQFQIGGGALFNALITKQLEKSLYGRTLYGCANDFDDVVEVLIDKEHQQAVLDLICTGKWVTMSTNAFEFGVFCNVVDKCQPAKLNGDDEVVLHFVFCSTVENNGCSLSQIMFPPVEMCSDKITWYMHNPYSLLVAHSLYAHRTDLDYLAILYIVDYLRNDGITVQRIGTTIKNALPVRQAVQVLAAVSNMNDVRECIIW